MTLMNAITTLGVVAATVSAVVAVLKYRERKRP